MPPLVSVILPIFNGLPYLEQAISSVLSQSFKDFELIIINDGSRDDSGLVVEKILDPRIRFYQQANCGLAATLNRAISLARGRYIARQDQDDVCFPLRLQKQVAFLDANPDVGVVGTAAEIWVGNDRSNRLLKHPVNDASIKFGLLFDNYIVHSSVMVRRSVLEVVGYYSEDKTRQPPEDYELWSRVMKKYKLANLPEILMAYREVPTSMSRTGVNPYLHNLVKISAENIAWVTGLAVDSPEVVTLSKLSHGIDDGGGHRVRFSNMKNILNIAAQRIAKETGTEVPSRELEAILQARLNKLHFYYVTHRSGGFVNKVMRGWIGERIKSVAKKVVRGAHK